MTATGRPILDGIAGLADRAVDGVRVARVMALLALLAALGAGACVEQLLSTANDEPDGGRMLRAVMTEPRPVVGTPGRLAVVLVDGMRRDEALPAVESMAACEIALSTPTLSRPFQHALFSGVPSRASGVRSNRFTGRARHASLMDAIRDAGGQVFYIGEGLDWIPRMHGDSEDWIVVTPDALDEPLDRAIAGFSEAAPPALLVVHVVSTDSTAHAGGVHTEEHRAALTRANEVAERVAAAGTPLVVLSDHGHLDAGGHGGPEPIVARSPLYLRDVPAPDGPIETERLAPTFARALGVRPPRHAVLPPIGEDADETVARAGSLVSSGARASYLRLGVRRKWTMLFLIVWLVMTLGPIKRAFGFDRSVLPSLVLWPGLLVLGHLALGRPLSLSAIDGRVMHGARVLVLGFAAAALTVRIGYALGRGESWQRLRRAAACVGWSIAGSALATGAWVGFALGPWPISPLETYLPLLFNGAAIGGLLAVALLLGISSLRRQAG